MQAVNKVTLNNGNVYKPSIIDNGTISNNRYYLICAKSDYLVINSDKLTLLFNGQCALINSSDDFYIKNVSDDDCSFVIVYLNGDNVDGFIKNSVDFTNALITNRVLTCTPDKTLLELFLSRINIDITPTLTALAYALIGDFINGFYGFKNLTKSECANLLKQRIDNFDCITCNVYEEYKKYPISHTVLITEFKSLTNLTPIDYILNKKVELSKLLLKNTTLLVNEISEVAGHNSISHFIKKFKEKTGVTPLSYKNSK